MLGLLSRASMAELAEWHEAFMAEVIRPAILPIAQSLVQKHLAQGDLCAIVTATNEFVTAPIARAFGIPHLIGTIPEVRNGRYTGKIQGRSEEHTSELQSLMRISYAVFCLKNKTTYNSNKQTRPKKRAQ